MLGTTMVGYSGVVRCDSAPEARGTKWSESLQEGDLVRVEVRALPVGAAAGGEGCFCVCLQDLRRQGASCCSGI